MSEQEEIIKKYIENDIIKMSKGSTLCEHLWICGEMFDCHKQNCPIRTNRNIAEEDELKKENK